MENRARESKVRGLDHLGTPKLEDGVNSEDNLKKGEGFSRSVILKDMFTSNCEEREKVG